MQKSTFVLIFLLSAFLPALAITINIPADYATIQQGIDSAAVGDIVLVADGTYAGTGNKNLDFMGKAITVRSANGAANCIIDCENDGRGFYLHTAETSAAMIEGFTIRNGLVAGNYPAGCGGGIFCEDASPYITDCIIENCAASNEGMDFGSTHSIDPYSLPVDSSTNAYGGGIFLKNSDASISNCQIDNCIAYNYGGGIASANSDPTIESCTITGNSAGNFGGGVLFTSNSGGSMYDCTVQNNDSYFYAGGVYIGNSDPLIDRCFILDNTCDNTGGGLYLYFNATPYISNSIVAGNETANYGGGFYCHGTEPTIENNIIYDNRGYGGLYFVQSEDAIVRNNNAFDNDFENYCGGGMPADLGVADGINFNLDVCDTYYNIQLDPMFDTSVGATPFTLLPGSPCIDAGRPNDSRDNDSTFIDLGRNYYHQTVPVLTLTPANLNFPTLANLSFTDTELYHGNSMTVTIRNIGSAVFNIVDISFAEYGSIFSASASVDSIAFNQTSTITVTFTPQDDIDYTDVITISNGTDHDYSSISFNLTGTGILAPEINASADTLYFPMTALGDTADLPLVLSNTGSDSLLITGMTVSPHPAVFFTNFSELLGSANDTLLMPGENMTVTVSFAPADYFKYLDNLVIANNDAQLTVRLKNPYPSITVSADTMVFNETAVGDTTDMTMMVYNVGTGILRLDSLKILPDSSYFFVDFSAPALIDPGDSLEITVSFAPQGTVAYFDQLKIYNNDALKTVILTNTVPTMEVVDNPVIPQIFGFSPAYPNPFNPATTLQYTLPLSGDVSLVIFDLQGREVSRLMEGFQTAGTHSITWNAESAASGIYFARLTVGENVQTQELLLLK